MIVSKTPNKFLFCKIYDISGYEVWPFSSSDIWAQNQNFYRWTAKLILNVPQQHSSQYTQTPYIYNGLDVSVGDWIGSDDPVKCLKIVQVTNKTEFSADVIIEDVERFNTFYDASGFGNGVFNEGFGYIFNLGDDGMPLLTPITEHRYISKTFFQDINNRFAMDNLKIKIRIFQANHNLTVGQELYLDRMDGRYKPMQTGKIPVGKVLDVSDGNNTFIIRSISPIVEGITLPGIAGDIVYFDDDNPGSLTTIVNSRRAYLKLTNTTGLSIPEKDISSELSSISFGVTIYPNIASLPVSASIGAMAYVQNDLSNEWKMFIYVSSGWVEFSSKDTAATDANTLSITINYDDVSPILLGNVSQGSRISLVTVEVVEPFNGITPATLTIGDDAEQDRIMSNDLLDMENEGVYQGNAEFIYDNNVDTDIKAYLEVNGASQGTAIITISYQ